MLAVVQVSNLPTSLKRRVPVSFPPTQLVDAAFLEQNPQILTQARHIPVPCALLSAHAASQPQSTEFAQHQSSAWRGSHTVSQHRTCRAASQHSGNPFVAVIFADAG